MRSLRSTVMGIVVGIAVGTLSLLIVYAGLSLSGQRNSLPMAVVISALSGSMTAGAICVALRYLLTGRERSLLAPLVTVAVASLVVLSGNYVNGSIEPPAMYGIALMNGLIIARVVSPLCAAGFGSENRTLS